MLPKPEWVEKDNINFKSIKTNFTKKKDESRDFESLLRYIPKEDTIKSNDPEWREGYSLMLQKEYERIKNKEKNSKIESLIKIINENKIKNMEDLYFYIEASNLNELLPSFHMYSTTLQKIMGWKAKSSSKPIIKIFKKKKP